MEVTKQVPGPASFRVKVKNFSPGIHDYSNSVWVISSELVATEIS